MPAWRWSPTWNWWTNTRRLITKHVRRQHRWIRGDWQILFWLFPFVPSRHGIKRNTLPLIGRWKILDNLRRSLVAPTLLAMLVAAWTILPGPLAFWLTSVLTVIASQLLPLVGRLLVGPRRAQSFAVFSRNLREDTITGLGQVALGLTFLANNSWETIHAIVLTLVRLVVTRRRLLEWETAAATAERWVGLDRPQGRATVCRSDDRESDHRPGRCRPGPRDAPGRHHVGRTVPAPLGVGAGGGATWLSLPGRPAATVARDSERSSSCDARRERRGAISRHLSPRRTAGCLLTTTRKTARSRLSSRGAHRRPTSGCTCCRHWRRTTSATSQPR